jgi:dTMP kinase
LRTVALIGIDGSGKTTQARRLAVELTALGVPARYRQNAGGRRWFGRLAGRLGRRDALALLGRRGLLLVESTLRWLAIARTLVRSSTGDEIAVMDRYAACQYASIRAHARRDYPAGRVSAGERLARLLYRVFPPADVTFLLAVEPGEAYRRIEARASDHETMEYLTAADAAYRGLPEFPTFVLIDANRTPDEVAAAIRAGLVGWLPVAATASAGPTEVPPVPVVALAGAACGSAAGAGAGSGRSLPG